MRSSSAVLKVMSLSVSFQPMGIFCFRRSREFTFSKNVYSPFIFLSPHLLPSQVFHFAVASSSLAFLSVQVHSTIELEYEKYSAVNITFYLASETDTFCPVQCCSQYFFEFHPGSVYNHFRLFSLAVSIMMKL